MPIPPSFDDPLSPDAGTPSGVDSDAPAAPDTNESVEFLNGLARRSGLQTALAMGRYVLDTWFEGRASRFERLQGTTPGYQALLAHPALELTPRKVTTAVRVTVQYEILPEEIAARLSLSHHQALVRVEDPDLKAELATEALKLGLNWERLQVVVSSRVARPLAPTGPGRRRYPPHVKRLRALHRAVKVVLEEPAALVEILECDLDHWQEVLPKVREDLKRLEIHLAEFLARIEPESR